MKRPFTKKELQAQLERQVKAYLEHGGNIEQIQRGESGLDHAKPWINPFTNSEQESKKTRTPVPEIVAAIDARKTKSVSQAPKNTKHPRKKWILDDFGEPVRWVWSDQ